jgi:hypothetical protein
MLTRILAIVVVAVAVAVVVIAFVLYPQIAEPPLGGNPGG